MANRGAGDVARLGGTPGQGGQRAAAVPRHRARAARGQARAARGPGAGTRALGPRAGGSPPGCAVPAPGALRPRACPASRSLQARASMSEPILGQNVLLYEPVVFGSGCRIEDGAIVGRVPVLASTSSALRKDPGPTVLEDGATVCAGAIVFAGARICEGAIVGDRA